MKAYYYIPAQFNFGFPGKLVLCYSKSTFFTAGGIGQQDVAKRVKAMQHA